MRRQGPTFPHASAQKTGLAAAGARLLASTLCLSLLLGPAGCRKKTGTMAPITLGDVDQDLKNQKGHRYGPSWQSGFEATLENSMQMIWLSRPDASRMDARIIVPLPGPKESSFSAAAIEVVFALIERQLSLRAQRAGLVLSRDDRPGRTEFALHGPSEQLKVALFLFSKSFAASASKRMLSEVQGHFVASWVDNPIDHSARAQLSKLLGVRAQNLYATGQDIAKLSSKKLSRAWTHMTDPSRITLVISAPKQTPDNEKTLQALAQRWSEGKSSSTTPLERLFTPSKASKAKGSGSLRQTQIKRVKTKIKSPNDRITWIATRRLALKSAKARAYARLAQRTLQHEFDVRLVVHQGTGIWQLRTELSPNPERAAKELRIHLGQLDKALHEGFVPGRARQAARTWLGARLVENSLQGEDWTDLWSESLDLSQNLKTLPTAMQRNGAIMMGANAEEFQRWMHENIDPSLAKGPWMSEIVFANPKAVTALNRARMQAPPED